MVEGLSVFLIGVIPWFLIVIFYANPGSSKISKIIFLLFKAFAPILLSLFFVIAIPTGVVSIVDRISKTNAPLIVSLISTFLSALVAVIFIPKSKIKYR